MTSIFIISRHLLFGRGLAKLLHQHNKFRVVGQEEDMDKAIPKIKDLQPNVVIVYGTEPPDGESPTKSRSENGSSQNSDTTIIEILEATPNIKVIGLNVHNNSVQVYKVSQRVAKSVSDLVKAIIV